MLVIGDTAPNFTQNDFNSAHTGSPSFTLSDHAGKVILLAFIAYK
jgi:hypothetical protein